MSTYEELMNDMFIEENKGKVTGIQIHPEWFNKLAADKKSTGRITLNIQEKDRPTLVFHKLDGIDLLITKDVDKWGFLFDEGGR